MLFILFSKDFFNLNELHYFMFHHFMSEGAHFAKRISYFLNETSLFYLKLF